MDLTKKKAMEIMKSKDKNERKYLEKLEMEEDVGR